MISISRFKILVFLLMLLPVFSFSANRFWIAGVASNWNNTANWSTTSGGAGGASVPGAADIAIFNASGNGNYSIDAIVNVDGFQITGYSGIISQNAIAITIGATGFSQNSGTFTGGTANITQFNGFICIIWRSVHFYFQKTNYYRSKGCQSNRFHTQWRNF